MVIDVANVMGARADGWWRDRTGAALRLCREVIALARRGAGGAAGDEPEAAAWVLVLEGLAREAAAAVAEDLPSGGQPPVRVVSAPGSGDDAIVGLVAEVVACGDSCLVVTADRELRRRCEELNASVVGPGWLLRQL